MKKLIVPLSALSFMMTSCSYNTATGKHEVSIMFWFFIAGISITTILLIWLIFRKYPKGRNKKK